MSTKSRLHSRLRTYWKIERLNIVVLPLVAISVVAFVFRSQITLAFAIALLATAWMLVVGTIALRMLHKVLERDRAYADNWLP